MTPAQLRALLVSGEEFALLDVREQGVHFRGHPFFAISLPLSHLELRIARLVPRKAVRLVLLDSGNEGLAERAAAKLRELGYTRIEVLDGGCAAWVAEGGELFSGINVPSKAFGEFVEHHYATPRIAPDELHNLIASGCKLAIVDARPAEEFALMSIPGAVNIPGAELVWRTPGLIPDQDTLVVVNCAGRTRSIIGCQSLRNAGWRNVVALKDGTMGWNLAGLSCETGRERLAVTPSAAGQSQARLAADAVARRYAVKFIGGEEMRTWLADPHRTTYLFDVRTPQEFTLDHLAGARLAPGGQLIQSTDEFVGVRNARIVLTDPEGVRAVMTASWLIQMGWDEIYVLEGETAGWPRESGAQCDPAIAIPDWPAISAAALETELGSVATLDLSTSLQYRARHIPGARWAVRARLSEVRQLLPEARRLVLTCGDGKLARLAAPEAAALWPQSSVSVLEGGNQAWFAAGLSCEAGLTQPTTTNDDVWYKPYDHDDPAEYERQARAYLEWEVGLVDQIKRDPAIRFRTFE
jgi:rhodanese-related sulfurtransferase